MTEMGARRERPEGEGEAEARTRGRWCLVAVPSFELGAKGMTSGGRGLLLRGLERIIGLEDEIGIHVAGGSMRELEDWNENENENDVRCDWGRIGVEVIGMF